MSDGKQSMQADGGGEHKVENPKPRLSGAGESGGGAYPNPHTGKKPQGGFLGHGGQTEIEQKVPGKLLGDLGQG